MLYANDEIFNVGYNENVDKVEIKSNKKNKLSSFISTHKLITAIITLFVLFSVTNCLLIYSFMVLLKNI